jgi:gamma-glutamyl phosphate reductase
MKASIIEISECSRQIKKAVGDALELLSEEKQKQVILNVCALIKEQRSELFNEAQQNPARSEELAVSTCSINDEALAEQERILEEIITKHNIKKVTRYDFEKHRHKPS